MRQKQFVGKLGGQLGVGLCVAGFLLVFLGWNGAASRNFLPAQFPYLISGGITGLCLVVVGVGTIVVQNQRADRAALQRTLEQLIEAVEHAGAARTNGAGARPSPGDLVAGGDSYPPRRLPAGGGPVRGDADHGRGGEGPRTGAVPRVRSGHARAPSAPIEGSVVVLFRVMAGRRAGLVGAYVVAVVVLLACTGSDSPTVVGEDGAPVASETPTTPTTAATTTTTTDPRRGSGNPVVLAFAGDINFEGRIGDRLAADPSTVMREIAPVLGSADLTVVNLETAITEGGTAAPKEFTFRAPASALDALRAAGVDVASQANNHGMDFGPEGLQDSLAARAEKQFPVIGIGQDIDEAFTPYRATINGQRITVIGATQVLDDSLIDLWTAGPGKPGLASAKLVDHIAGVVAAARADSDTVVVFLHWGIERNSCPSESQQSLAATLAAAGADIVVGSHAHRLQGGGRLGQAFVHYGLGNFMFYAGNAEGARTGVLLITATGRDIDAYQWVPARIEDRIPVPLEGGEADEALAYWDSLRDCTGLTP